MVTMGDGMFLLMVQKACIFTLADNYSEARTFCSLHRNSSTFRNPCPSVSFPDQLSSPTLLFKTANHTVFHEYNISICFDS